MHLIKKLEFSLGNKMEKTLPNLNKSKVDASKDGRAWDKHRKEIQAECWKVKNAPKTDEQQKSSHFHCYQTS